MSKNTMKTAMVMKTQRGFRFRGESYDLVTRKTKPTDEDATGEEGVFVVFRVSGFAMIGGRKTACMNNVSEEKFNSSRSFPKSITVDTYKVVPHKYRPLVDLLRKTYPFATISITSPNSNFPNFDVYPKDGKTTEAVRDLLGFAHHSYRKGYCLQPGFWTRKEAESFRRKLRKFGDKVSVVSRPYWSITYLPSILTR